MIQLFFKDIKMVHFPENVNVFEHIDRAVKNC